MPSPGDWSSWYYVKKLLVDVPTDSPLLSLIPEQGPFHVTLNAHETAVELHRFFFAELHKHLFNSAMPERPILRPVIFRSSNLDNCLQTNG